MQHSNDLCRGKSTRLSITSTPKLKTAPWALLYYLPPPLRKHAESQETDSQTGSPCLDKTMVAQREWGVGTPQLNLFTGVSRRKPTGTGKGTTKAITLPHP